MSEEMLTRQNITSGAPLNIETGVTSSIGSHSSPRVFVDSLTIAGESFDKNIVAIDGGEDVTKADKATAAAAIIAMTISPGSINPTVTLTLGVLINSNTRAKLEEKISQVLNSGTNDIKIKLGAANKKQEFKTDEKWGVVADVSNFEFFPISPRAFSFHIDPTDLMGVSKNGMRYHIIEIGGLTTEKGELNVCSAASTDKGVAKIGYISAS
ncbi:intracellular growth locus C protein [Candidatus Francisella endociliophora]|uniref:Intracellular growth locus C protein n=1 Tax=Candidatus Francisella endociliophora TaxID=653937 RepID=A0A097EPV6_9GAMM|nr:type VI secretion system tube protein IglC [Francisella sp. FSC1006]AIT09602.1 intracellular growth locus C protein [Francisella sp. FSC1006]